MKSAIGRFAVRHAVSIVFLVLALCLGGGYAARKMGSSVFPETDFPRVVIMADNGSGGTTNVRFIPITFGITF
jgi:multidrug efflux pump subunit AcrB